MSQCGILLGLATSAPHTFTIIAIPRPLAAVLAIFYTGKSIPIGKIFADKDSATSAQFV
jgi:hypothetical protein